MLQILFHFFFDGNVGFLSGFCARWARAKRSFLVPGAAALLDKFVLPGVVCELCGGHFFSFQKIRSLTVAPQLRSLNPNKQLYTDPCRSKAKVVKVLHYWVHHKLNLICTHTTIKSKPTSLNSVRQGPAVHRKIRQLGMRLSRANHKSPNKSKLIWLAESCSMKLFVFIIVYASFCRSLEAAKLFAWAVYLLNTLHKLLPGCFQRNLGCFWNKQV